MSKLPNPSAATPPKAALDYYHLRREGIGLIEGLSSDLWTDYNTHDPGITILEALCYALTDVAYRSHWDVRDILTRPAADPLDPFPEQPFFTAREILTVNPVSTIDFRRLLIDLDVVRNAWVRCKTCACDVLYYAWCEKDRLQLAYRKPSDGNLQVAKVEPAGLYEVLVELEADPDLGDLNDRKLELVLYDAFDDDGRPHPVTLELRFPEWPLAQREDRYRLLSSAAVSGVTMLKLVRSKADAKTVDDEVLRADWNRVFYASLKINLEFPLGTQEIVIDDAALRLYGDAIAKAAATVDGLRARLEDTSPTSGFVPRYRAKLRKIEDAIETSREVLHQHRNLDEDYCFVRGVEVEDVAVCADIEVTVGADIERVQARIWFEIEQYFNPPICFYTLRDLMDEGIPVEEIFQGPKLSSGFLKAGELEAAQLKTELRVSDIVNRLMDIDGVVAVNNLLLTKYDAEGNVIHGAADPAWNGSDPRVPILDPYSISASWLLLVSDQHQPRLYLNQSRFLFFKNGLPFKPRLDEARDTLMQLRGEAERPKIKTAPKDLPAPAGTLRKLEDYFPVQYSFPLTYGIGPEGLPAHASSRRRAQAKQLKAYLLVYEQLLANAFAQLAHTAELFSMSEFVDHTYFVRHLNGELIAGHDELVAGLDKLTLADLVESPAEFHERRNRFLDHLLARFGERLEEYALLLTEREGRNVALDELITTKLKLLKGYPQLSHDRGRAFNYCEDPCAADNSSGLKRRVGHLLGEPEAWQRAILIEHLLLRPKFPGDALYPVCSDGPCHACGDEDPYSFRLTFVVPGWTAPFNTDMEMRRFAERTIRQETPSHLLIKTCWVGNDGFVEDEYAAVICNLADLLEREGRKPDAGTLTREESCADAKVIHDQLSAVFRAWYEDKTLVHHQPVPLRAALQDLFRDHVDRTNIAAGAELNDALWAKVCDLTVEAFIEIALHGWQFERFEDAWCAWLEANSTIDWTQERLQETVEAILSAKLLTASVNQKDLGEALCRCAASILADFGTAFYDWREANVRDGRALQDFSSFDGGTITLCSDMTFAPDTAKTIKTTLSQRYDAYKEVSYRLRIVVDLLSCLSNTYPVATLHDCDDGSDQNPVRLGQTALGSLR